MALPTGATAPDFTLRRKTAEGMVDITLSSHFGKQPVVLLFFPAAFTHVCTAELCDTSGDIGDVQGLKAAVYGISTDSAYAQEAWAKQEKIKVPLLSDFAFRVTDAYDVVFPDLSGLGPCAARAAFVIGKDGIIKYSEQCPALTDLPDFGKIKAALAGE